MNRYPTRNPFEPLLKQAVNAAISGAASVADAATASALIVSETQTDLVTVDPVTGATQYPFELNSDVLNDPNARLYAL